MKTNYLNKYESIKTNKYNDLKKIKNLIHNLRSDINFWNNEYYVLNKSSISDFEYDKLLRILNELERKFPQFYSKNSPTQKLIENIHSNFKKIPHNYPMLSISNGFDKKDILEFTNRCSSFFDGKKIDYIFEQKIDGVSIALIYKKGVLVESLTRGNGIYGESVVNNILFIDEIPKKLTKSIDIEIRGEIYLDIDLFNHYLKIYKNKKSISNPRNICSGLVRSENINNKDIETLKKLCFTPYYIVDALKYNIKTQNIIFDFLQNLGFKITNDYQWGNIKKGFKFYEKTFQKIKQNLFNFQMDGIVIKINNLELQKQMGFTSKFVRWAIAYKFKESNKVTKLLSYETNIGKSGKVTYIASLKPIIIDYTKVSRVTLNNINYIKKNKIGINSIVTIKKSGGIIPKIIKIINDENYIPIKKLLNCYSCGDKIVDIGSEQYCININCKSRIINSILYFCSKDALDIQGLGKRQINQLYEESYIKNISDLYCLKNYYEQIISNKKISISKKVLAKVLFLIDESKNKNLNLYITGFNIFKVGKARALEIAKYYKDIDLLLKCKLSDFQNFGSFSNITSKIIFDFFHNKDNILFLQLLKKQGVRLIQNIKIQHNQKIKNKVFVITGALSKQRNNIENLIQECGGKISRSITKKTDILIAGQNPGSKYEKAKKFNIKIINEKEFDLLIK